MSFGFPIFIGVFFQRHYDRLEDEDFKKKYGVIYESLDLREWGRYTFIYPFFSVLRMLLLPLIVVFMIGNGLA